jgi:DNA-binding response OmpR family regulator
MSSMASSASLASRTFASRHATQFGTNTEACTEFLQPLIGPAGNLYDRLDLIFCSRYLRPRKHDVPVIIVTGNRVEEIDRVVGLELGADKGERIRSTTLAPGCGTHGTIVR